LATQQWAGQNMRRTWKTVKAQFILLLMFSIKVSACPECRAQVKSEIFGASFGANLFIVLLPIVLIVTLGIGLYYADGINDKIRKGAARWQTSDDVTH
jgi:hypothetical protein